MVQRKSDLTDSASLMRVVDDLSRLPERFDSAAQFAIVSFDTRPHVWADFTGDRAELRRVIRSLPSSTPSSGLTLRGIGSPLGDPWDPSRQELDSMEECLTSLGDALGRLPGAKTVLIVGYGLGEWIPRLNLVTPNVGYDEALAALSRGRVNVFCIDTTQAEYHPRQEGLVQLAFDSGGRFWSAREFTSLPFDEFRQLTAGYYVLSLVPPDEERGRRSLSVRLVRHRGVVLAKRSPAPE